MKINDRIKKENDRLLNLFDNMDGKKKSVILGLIERAAFMRVTLEDLEADINISGMTEKFKQGENQPEYTRERPAARLYNTMNASYQKIVNQLTNLLPADEQSDEFDDFEEFRRAG